MTKTEAKELIIDIAKVNGNNRFDAESYANAYLDDPNRTIKFDDDEKPVRMIDLKCPSCNSTNLARFNDNNVYQCITCNTLFGHN